MSNDKIKQDDITYCESIAKSVAEIIRFSFDEEFRKYCLKLFDTHSTKQTEQEISKRLISMIENESAVSGSRKKHKQLLKEKDKENQQEPNMILEKNETENYNTSSDRNSKKILQNPFGRNWLEISSQQYRNVIKRKKLQFYSQPQFPVSSEKDFEFSTNNLNPSYSQPNSEASAPVLNEILDSSMKPSSSGKNFCKNKFKESFRDNACKYFKKNLTSRKPFNF